MRSYSTICDASTISHFIVLTKKIHPCLVIEINVKFIYHLLFSHSLSQCFCRWPALTLTLKGVFWVTPDAGICFSKICLSSSALVLDWSAFPFLCLPPIFFRWFPWRLWAFRSSLFQRGVFCTWGCSFNCRPQQPVLWRFASGCTLFPCCWSRLRTPWRTRSRRGGVRQFGGCCTGGEWGRTGLTSTTSTFSPATTADPQPSHTLLIGWGYVLRSIWRWPCWACNFSKEVGGRSRRTSCRCWPSGWPLWTPFCSRRRPLSSCSRTVPHSWISFIRYCPGESLRCSSRAVLSWPSALFPCGPCPTLALRPPSPEAYSCSWESLSPAWKSSPPPFSHTQATPHSILIS